nr:MULTISPECIES: hypothetical protein [unclassified Bradyrhizobium]
MWNAATVLRSVLNEVCVSLSQYETSARVGVALRILESASAGETRCDRLKEVGREARFPMPR